MTTPSRLSAEMNVTPMIDVLLVLLVIFMLIVPQVRRMIPVQLPNPAPDVVDELAPVIAVEARGGGRYVLDGARPGSADASLTRVTLSSRLRSRHAAAPDAPLFVGAAEWVRYGEVFAALDVARGPGCGRWR
jgi:biopolymer transport protein TolR